MKNNLESEDFLKNIECNLTFLKSDKEYIFFDETSERDSYSTIVILLFIDDILYNDVSIRFSIRR